MNASAHKGSRSAARDSTQPCVAVVGGGIVGLAHAWAAARRGWRVLLFDRHAQPHGASVRNFGMVWPIGQPNGPLHRTALRSRRLWQELAQEAGLWFNPCGSLHLAYRDDEWAVLEEFAHAAPVLGYQCELLSPAGVMRRSPAVRRHGLIGGMWSGTEACVDPREVVRLMPTWLHTAYGVDVRYNTPICEIGRHEVVAADRRRWSVDQVVVATGADVSLLYPELYRQARFKRCKLQMYRTVTQPRNWSIGPMLAGGLTLRHYATFGVCRSLAALSQRIAAETPELDQFGIHVMASQNGRGEVVLGDSHEFGDEVEPFDKTLVDELIFRELRRMIDLPDWTVAERWHGVYVKAPETVQFVADPEFSVHIAIASGGCGMTMSFGLADEQWTAWHGPVDAECGAPPSPSANPAAVD